MKKLVIWGFRKSSGDIIRKLKDKYNCEVIEWFGRDKESTYFFGDLIKCKIPSTPYKPCDQDVYNQVYQNFWTYFIMHNRKNQVFINKEKFYDYIDFFNVYFHFFYNLLTSTPIDALVFSNLPHIGPDYIFYQIAKAMKINVILFMQSIHPNKFFCVNDITEIGNYLQREPLYKYELQPIEKKFHKELFYMNSLKNKSLFNFIKLPSVFFFKKRIFWFLLRPLSYTSYLRELRNLEVKTPDFDKKFVYFPLHMQPELTTSTFGGKYLDQALALERLSELLPPDWYIYVKESTGQTEYNRGNAFFKRLKSIPNLKMIPLEISTYQLIDKCQFVATVTGTAGYEAITGGKNALVFGRAWYKELPGVFTYKPDLNIDEIINYRINHSELEEKMSELLRRMPNGVVSEPYIQNYKDYNHEKNCEMVADTINKMINYNKASLNKVES